MVEFFGSNEYFSRFNPLEKILNNPELNPKLKLLQKAYLASAKYHGSVPGGRTSPATIQALNLALQPGTIKNVITGEQKEIHGYVPDLGKNIFGVIERSYSDPSLTLKILAKRREEFQAKEAANKELQQYVKNIGKPDYSDPAIISKLKQTRHEERQEEIAKTLRNLGIPGYEINKPDSGKTKLPNTYSYLATERDAFDSNQDLVSDFAEADLDNNLDLSLNKYSIVSKDSEVAITELISQGQPSQEPTHVAINLTGTKETKPVPAHPDVDYETYGDASGQLIDKNGNILSSNTVHYLSYEDFQQLKYKGLAEDSTDVLSVVAYKDVDGDGVLTAVDEKSNYAASLIRTSLEPGKLYDPISKEYSYQTNLPLPATASTSSVTLKLDGDIDGNDFNALIQSGQVQLEVYEQGLEQYQAQKANIIATSSGNTIKLEFDRQIKDGIDIVIKLGTQNLANLSSLSASFGY